MAKKSSSNTTNISIPTTLADNIKIRCKETGFNSVSEYVTFVLEQVLLNIKSEKKEVYSKEEKKKVSNRLKGLGYLD